MPSTRIIINGGRGGPGGPGNNRGGSGGTGQGPKVTLKTYRIRRASFNVNRDPPTPSWTADFHAVKLADLILDEEIHSDEVPVDDSQVVQRRRRVYRARIFGHEAPMTAVVYSNDIFQKMKDGVLTAQRLRHPLFAHLFGLHCSTAMNALVYHDEMVTISQVEDMHFHSVFASRCILFALKMQYAAADVYLLETVGRSMRSLSGSIWIRLSTGQVCFDIGNGARSFYRLRGAEEVAPYPWARFNLARPHLVDILAQTLTFDNVANMFHFTIPRRFPWTRHREGGISLPSITLLDHSSPLYPFLSSVPTSVHFIWRDWHRWNPGMDSSIDESHGWTPYAFSNFKTLKDPHMTHRIEYTEKSFPFTMSVGLSPGDADTVKRWWIAQEPHIRQQWKQLPALQHWSDPDLHLITSAVTVCNVDMKQDGFTLRGTFMAEKLQPVGKIYLLLFRPTLREQASGHLQVVLPPDSERYYWAFDRDGRDRLTDDMVEDLGLLTPYFSDHFVGSSSHVRDSDFVRSFIAAKGFFDPDGQDAAIAFGYPLMDCESFTRKIPSGVTGQGATTEEEQPRMPGAWV